MRIGLEGLACRLGTDRIDDSGLEELRLRFADLEAAADADDIDAFIQTDREFHRLHYLASGRESLWKRIITLRSTVERYTRLGYHLPEVGLSDTVHSHGRLLDAVLHHDSGRAETELVQDLNKTFDVVHTKLLAEEDQEI